jgi:hypothetical protein
MWWVFNKYHWISNFPKKYPYHKKLLANFIYFVTGIIIHPRKNALTHTDLIHARLKLRKGDICLWGNLRELSALLIKGPVTHSSIYVGRKKFIEAVGDGVHLETMHHLFITYDTLIILRIPRDVGRRKKKIKDAIKFAKEQIGKPYDFDFTGTKGKFFCTELVNYAYKKANHDTKLSTIGKFRDAERSFVKKMIHASRALQPIKFAEDGNFDIIFMSHNLKVKKKISLRHKF